MKRSSPRQKIHFVSHSERFSDLHIHLYDEKKIIPLNPVAALHYSKVGLLSRCCVWQHPWSLRVFVFLLVCLLISPSECLSACLLVFDADEVRSWCVCCRLLQIVGEGLADDFYVPPQDGLHFYFCLSKMLGASHEFSQTFRPDIYFQGTAAITKKQYRSVSRHKTRSEIDTHVLAVADRHIDGEQTQKQTEGRTHRQLTETMLEKNRQT